MELVRDVWRNEIFPLLDDISFLCLQAAFCHTKLISDNCDRCVADITKYSVPFGKYFIDNLLVTNASNFLLCTVENGNLELLKELNTNYNKYNGKTLTFYLICNHLVKSIPMFKNRYTCSWSLIGTISTKYGHVNILNYIAEQFPGQLTANNIKVAIKHEQLECYKFYRGLWPLDSNRLAADLITASAYKSFICLRHIISEPMFEKCIGLGFDNMTREEYIKYLLYNAILCTDDTRCLDFLISYFKVTTDSLQNILLTTDVDMGITSMMIKYLTERGVVLMK